MKHWVLAAVWAGIVALHWVVQEIYVPSCFGRYPPPPMIHWWVDDDIWIHALLLFSPLVLMPLGESLAREPRCRAMSFGIEAAAAVLLAVSLLMSTHQPYWHLLPVACAVPWLVVRLVAAGSVMLSWWRDGMPALDRILRDMAVLFPAVGAAWLVAHRAGFTPWGFDPLIVLLTAAHFHHAGFTLPLMAGLNARARLGWFTRALCVAILAGIPLVALGITGTHFGVLRFVEPAGVGVLVLGALGLAGLQISRGVEFRSGLGTWTRAAFLISGASLFLAMVLALGFGLRYVIPGLALTMPQMWMIHGTLNTFGFGLCGVLAWRGGRDAK